MPELSRLYRLVQQIISYQEAVASRSAAVDAIAKAGDKLKLTEERAAGNKKAEKELKAAARGVADAEEALKSLDKKIAQVDSDPQLKALAVHHADLETRAQLETVKLHQGDAENMDLWHKFMPYAWRARANLSAAEYHF